MNQPKRLRRNSTRWPGHDYRHRGAYFITLVTRQREMLFGDIRDNRMILNSWGTIAHTAWHSTTPLRPDVTLADLIVMPNHVHAIIHLIEAPAGVPPSSITDIIRGYKGTVTAAIRRVSGIHDLDCIWQRNYHDRVIRNEDEYRRIAEYIRENPARWQHDCFNSLTIAT
ncbi:MAG: transposase [Fluviicoccus sp.]|uniref:transposase n=1 Tax=Fluviicoccus sp. TaxID=2003552 RepID=UPI0027280179|nr:transposase [Fluviicoccus sp.]MDO8332095.1 transposase [Fluviicoccus sp.]